jgi:hypothetical protein
MALAFTTTAAGASSDYRKYLFNEKVTKTDNKNAPTLFEFSLAPTDASFVKLVRGNYITFNTVTYPNWFTGFIINDPELVYLGTKASAPVFGYKYQAMSDELILNLKPIGIVPPFINMNMGDILKYLAARLCPGMFTTSSIQSGLRLARYVPEPQQTFSDVVKKFTDMAQYRFRANAMALSFAPQDGTACGITVDGNSKHFSPSRLTLTANADPIINEAVVLGDIEPQQYLNEYFYGDGLTGQFPLMASPYGVDRTVLINEDFTGGTLDGSIWNEVDTAADFLQLSNGYLNALGGLVNNSYGIYLQTQQLLPLEGNIRFTHGEFDFVNSGTVSTVQGIIGGVWTGNPARTSDTVFPGCVFGIRVLRNGSGIGKLNAIYNGTMDGVTPDITVDYTKRYVIRTLMSCNLRRNFQKYNYIDSAGVVRTRGCDPIANTATFTTFVSEISTSDGTVSNTWTLSGTASLSTAIYYAFYCPVVSNDLHCTVSGITVSTPMQAQLEIKPSGGSYVQKLVGPNEMDSLDGQAPTATIVDSNNGVSTKSTTLGTPQFNPGNASLGFFKDSTKQTATTPQVGDTVHLSYRKAGAAMGRVRDTASIDAEAALWGDNGVRSIVRSDLSPLPHTSRDCEAAAGAIVGDSKYQHYDGTYQQFSTYFAAEPLSGTILPFANLPASFPSIVAEELNQVKTTMLSSHPTELFDHVLTFGKPDVLSRFLTKFVQQESAFNPQDTAEIPNWVTPSTVDLVAVEDVIAPTLTSLTSSTLTFNTNQAAPSGGGFEVRYSDEGWGADDGKNLVSRSSSQVFTAARNVRNRAIYVRAYDARNKLPYSEDFTQSAWATYFTGPTVTKSTKLDPDGNLATICTAVLGASAASRLTANTTLSADTPQTVVYSISVKGTAGDQVTQAIRTATANNVSQIVVLTGKWQRIVLTATMPAFGTGNFIAAYLFTNSVTPVTVDVGRASVELGSVETMYCKTNATAYGALSRYTSIVRVSFPLVPPAPTATLDTVALALNPLVSKINIVLPGVTQDVWGVEIRASDNTTVLYHKDLIDPQYVFQFSTVNASRSMSYFVYTYNLLGEFSSSYNLVNTITTPAINTPTVDDPTKAINWTVSAGSPTGYKVEIDATSNAFGALIVNTTTTDKFYQLLDQDFFSQRWIRITPFDAIGNGTAVTVNSTSGHVYTASSGVVDQAGTAFNTTNNVQSILVPSAPTADPTYGSQFDPYAGDLRDESWNVYQRKMNRL